MPVPKALQAMVALELALLLLWMLACSMQLVNALMVIKAVPIVTGGVCRHAFTREPD